METVPHKTQKAKVRLSGKCDKDPGQLSNAKRTTTRKTSTPTQIPIQIQVETQPKSLINLWPMVSVQIQIQVQLQLQVQVQVYCALFSFSVFSFFLALNDSNVMA